MTTTDNKSIADQIKALGAGDYYWEAPCEAAADIAAAGEAALRAEIETLDALYARCNNDFIAMSADRDRLVADNANLRAQVLGLRAENEALREELRQAYAQIATDARQLRAAITDQLQAEAERDRLAASWRNGND